MKKVIGYLRVSTSNQDIKRQKMLISEYCKCNNYQLINYIGDEGISGATDERSGFQSLFDLQLSDCDMIILSELSRFSRSDSMIDVANQLKRITDNGIDIYILNTNKLISKGFDKEIIDVVTLVIESEAAAKERKKIKERCLSGKITKAKSSPFSIGACAKFGYKIENQTIIKDETDAEVVKDIFDKYCAGYSSKDIASYLLNINNSRKWNANYITKLLSEPLYTGLYNVLINGEKIEKYYPELRIISDEQFELAKEMLSKNSKRLAGKKTDKIFTLRNLIKCANCGRDFSIKNNKVYQCLTFHSHYANQGAKCVSSSLNIELTESAIFKAVAHYALTNKHLNNQTEELEQYNEQLSNYNQIKEVKENRISELNEEFKRYLSKAIKYNLSDSDIDEFRDNTDKDIKLINSELKDLNSKIKTLNKRIQFILNESNNSEAYSNLFANTQNDKELTKQMLEDFIDVIYVHSFKGFTMLQIIRKDGIEQYIFLKKWSKMVYHITSHDYQLTDGRFFRGSDSCTIEDMFNLILQQDTDIYILDLN